jgi:cation:H+ antiporter
MTEPLAVLILGVAASIRTLRVNAEIVWREIPMCLLAVIVMAVLANDRALDGGPTDVLTRIDGLVLLALFGVFIYYTVAGAMRVGRLGEAARRGDLGLGRALVYISVGLFVFMFTVRRHAIDRLEAAMFIALYAAYMGTLAVGAR